MPAGVSPGRHVFIWRKPISAYLCPLFAELGTFAWYSGDLRTIFHHKILFFHQIFDKSPDSSPERVALLEIIESNADNEGKNLFCLHFWNLLIGFYSCTTQFRKEISICQQVKMDVIRIFLWLLHKYVIEGTANGADPFLLRSYTASPIMFS